MQYSYEKLKNMSSDEINIAVAKKLNLEHQIIRNNSIEWVEAKNYLNNWAMFNPCEEWDDAMPIAIAQGIGITRMANGDTRVYHYTPFIGKNGNRSGFLNNDNPNTARAICEVFLMMDSHISVSGS